MKEKTEIIFIQMTPERYREALETASTLGAVRAMQFCGVPIKDMFTRAELSRRFGKGKINRMIEAGKLTPHRLDGGRSKYNLSEVLTNFI